MTTKIPVELSSTPSIVDNGDATAITIDSSENVGIGNTNPSATLDVAGRFTVASNDGHSDTKISSTSNRAPRLYFLEGSTQRASIQSQAAINQLTFFTGTSERMRIDSSGNVGIGITSPQGSFNKTGTLDVNGVIISRGALQAHQTNAVALENYNNVSRLRAYGANSGDGILAFNTGGGGGALDYERMRIDASGNLLIGRTDITRLGNGHMIRGGDSAIFSRDSSGETMQVCRNANAGDFVQFFSNNVEKGSIEYNGTNTLYNQSSDGRLKNITGEARGLEVINKLNPVAFNWKESGKADEGLIAQEVQEIFPNAVSNIEREYLQMDYSKLVTPLIKAIQEQQVIIEDLQTQINEVKNGN